MFDLLTIGDTKLDVFLDLGLDAKVACSKDTHRCTMCLKYGEKIPVDSAHLLPAGSALNVAVGVRRLGKKTSVLSVMGNDMVPVLTKSLLQQEHVDTTHLRIDKKTKSSVSAVLNFEGESTILTAHEPHAYSLPKILDAKWIFVGEMSEGYPSLYRQLLKQKQREGFKIALNPGAIQLEDLDASLYDLIKQTDLLVLNKTEAMRLALCETEEMEQILRKLQSMGPRFVVVTDGKKGACTIENNIIWHTPAFPGDRLEATGAGDAFITGLLTATLYKKDLKTAFAWGAVNSASVIGFVGGVDGLLKKTDLEDRLRKTKTYQVKSL